MHNLFIVLWGIKRDGLFYFFSSLNIDFYKRKKRGKKEKKRKKKEKNELRHC